MTFVLSEHTHARKLTVTLNRVHMVIELFITLINGSGFKNLGKQNNNNLIKIFSKPKHFMLTDNYLLVKCNINRNKDNMGI